MTHSRTGLRSFAAMAAVAVLAFTPPVLQAGEAPTPATLQMSTTSFTDGGPAPDKHTCLVKDPVSPGFTWIDPPTKTASFVLMFHVPDVHPNKGKEDSFHWAVWNIPASARALPEGLPAKTPLPDGSQQTINSEGHVGYAPMCGRPGKKMHYMFELFALDAKLTLPANPSREQILQAMDGHIIGKNIYIGRFSKPGPVGPPVESAF